MRTFIIGAVGLCAGLLPGQTGAAEQVLSNNKLRVHVRQNLTISVDDLTTQVTWNPDLWENSAGRFHLRGNHGEATTVNLGSAAQKRITPVSGPNGGQGLQIAIGDFRSRMGPVRDDRDPGSQLSLVLQVLLARDTPNLTFGIEEMKNRSQYWNVESIEWPLRLFPLRTVTDDGYLVFPQQEGMLIHSV